MINFSEIRFYYVMKHDIINFGGCNIPMRAKLARRSYEANVDGFCGTACCVCGIQAYICRFRKS